MNQDVLIKQIVEEVLKTMGGEAPVAKKECCQGSVSKENYPLGEKIPDQIKSQLLELAFLKFLEIFSYLQILFDQL